MHRSRKGLCKLLHINKAGKQTGTVKEWMCCFHLTRVVTRVRRAREKVCADVSSPYSTDTTCGESSWSNGGTLLHESSYREPETVPQRVLINEETTASLQAGVWVVPFIGGQPELQEREIQREGGKKKKSGTGKETGTLTIDKA